VPTDDQLECGLRCRECFGFGNECDDLASASSANFSICTAEYGQACWNYFYEDGDGNTWQTRGCAINNTECTNSLKEESCQEAGTGTDYEKECVRCCTTPDCNAVLLDGIEDGAQALYPLKLTSIIAAVVAMLTTTVYLM